MPLYVSLTDLVSIKNNIHRKRINTSSNNDKRAPINPRHSSALNKCITMSGVRDKQRKSSKEKKRFWCEGWGCRVTGGRQWLWEQRTGIRMGGRDVATHST